MTCYTGGRGGEPLQFSPGCPQSALARAWDSAGKSHVCADSLHVHGNCGCDRLEKGKTLQDSFMCFLNNRIEGHSGQDTGQVTPSPHNLERGNLLLTEDTLHFLCLTSLSFSGLKAVVRTLLTSSHLLSRKNRTLSATGLGSKPVAFWKETSRELGCQDTQASSVATESMINTLVKVTRDQQLDFSCRGMRNIKSHGQ